MLYILSYHLQVETPFFLTVRSFCNYLCQYTCKIFVKLYLIFLLSFFFSYCLIQSGKNMHFI